MGRQGCLAAGQLEVLTAEDTAIAGQGSLLVRLARCNHTPVPSMASETFRATGSSAGLRASIVKLARLSIGVVCWLVVQSLCAVPLRTLGSGTTAATS